MTRSVVYSWVAALIALLAIVALTIVTSTSADAAKPAPIIGASATHDSADCSADVEFTLNTRGRSAAVVVIGYLQEGTRARGTYSTHSGLARGETVTDTLAFNDAGNGLSTNYFVEYTAFAKNGRILDQAILATFDNSGCTQ